MKIKHNEIEISETSPFANCKLGREKYAETLTQIVGNYKDGFVLAINNEWGTGKTTFVKMWQQQLISKDFKTVYFNAWENDFEVNPLVAIISELNQMTKKETKKAFKSLVGKGAVLAKSILPQLVKAIAEKYIDTKVVTELIENTTKAATEILDEEIQDYAKKKNGIKEFKICLEQFIKDSTNDKPLVFIVDELDRCRPNYAVELLEQIKHLFSVSGIVFVLSIDKTQLGHAIRGVYGSENINAEEYLRRFIDIEYSIPEPKTKDFCNYLYNYFDFDSFFSQTRMEIPDLMYDRDTLIKTTIIIFEDAKLTLRQQEKVISQLRIGLIFFNNTSYLFPALYLMLIFLKNFHNDFYIKVKFKKFSTQELINEFSQFIPKGLIGDTLNSFIYIEALLVILYNNSYQYPPINPFEKKQGLDEISSSIFHSMLDKSENQQVFLRYLIVLYQRHSFNSTSIEYLLMKIDLTDQLSINNSISQ